jgi:hypothetical protein
LGVHLQDLEESDRMDVEIGSAPISEKESQEVSLNELGE